MLRTSRMQGLSGRRLHAAIWGVSCFAIMIFGYNQAAAGGVLTTPSFNKQFPEMDTLTTTGAKQQYNSTIQGTIVALYTLLGAFGALSCTFLGDIWGRRWTIWVSCLVQGIGCILMGSAYQFAQFIVARIVLGLGTGGIIATVSVYQSELSRANSRGGHVSGFGIFCGFGLIFALWISFGSSYADSSFSWRFPLVFPLLFTIIVMSTIFLLPESPRWLVKVGRFDEAKAILHRIYDIPVDEQSEDVDKEIREIQLSLDLAGSVKLSSMFKMGPQRTFHRVCLAAIIQVFLQLSGTNAISYYTNTLFEQQLGFPDTEARILAACLQFVLVLGSAVCSFTVDRFGRRPLMMMSGTLNAICFACLAGCVSQSHNPAALKAGVFFVYFFQFCFTLGLLGIPFLYASEIAPVHMRAAVCGLSTTVSWLFNYLVAEVTPVAFTSIGWRYFLVYMCTNALCVPVVALFYPETAGRSLEELDEIFAASKNIFDPVRVARKLPKSSLSTFLAHGGPAVDTRRSTLTELADDGGDEKGAESKDDPEHLEAVGEKL